MTINVTVNEVSMTVVEGTTVRDILYKVKPSADVLILNGFPVEIDKVLSEGDSLVLIKKGEIPSSEELEVLMASRHTPGVHKRLKKACVGIAGCGGLGSTVAVSLARVGIGTLVIVDFDVVEPSNLNRQQYFVDQIGQPKVEALAENIRRINPAVNVLPHNVRLTRENIETIFSNVQIIVEAFDRADQKMMLVETVEAKMPNVKLILGLGMAGYGFNNLIHTRSSGNIKICGDELSEASPGFGLMAPRVGIVANMQANLVLELLLGPDPRIQQLLERSSKRL